MMMSICITDYESYTQETRKYRKTKKKKHIIKIEKKSVTSSQKQSEWYENVDYVSTHIHTHIVSSCSFNMRNKIQNPCAMENKWKNNNNKISEKK